MSDGVVLFATDVSEKRRSMRRKPTSTPSGSRLRHCSAPNGWMSRLLAMATPSQPNCVCSMTRSARRGSTARTSSTMSAVATNQAPTRAHRAPRSLSTSPRQELHRRREKKSIARRIADERVIRRVLVGAVDRTAPDLRRAVEPGQTGAMAKLVRLRFALDEAEVRLIRRRAVDERVIIVTATPFDRRVEGHCARPARIPRKPPVAAVSLIAERIDEQHAVERDAGQKDTVLVIPDARVMELDGRAQIARRTELRERKAEQMAAVLPQRALPPTRIHVVELMLRIQLKATALGQP